MTLMLDSMAICRDDVRPDTKMRGPMGDKQQCWQSGRCEGVHRRMRCLQGALGAGLRCPEPLRTLVLTALPFGSYSTLGGLKE